MEEEQPRHPLTRGYTIAAILMVLAAAAWGTLGDGLSAAIANTLIRLASLCLGALVIVLGVMRLWRKR
jgi:hypothetical protein